MTTDAIAAVSYAAGVVVSALLLLGISWWHGDDHADAAQELRLIVLAAFLWPVVLLIAVLALATRLHERILRRRAKQKRVAKIVREAEEASRH